MPRLLFGCVVVAVVAAGCNSAQEISAPGIEDLEIRAAKAPSSSYSATVVAPLAGYEENYVFAVNDAGYAAIQNVDYSTAPLTAAWVIRSSAQQSDVIGQSVKGFSAGTTPYVAGGLESRWTYSPSTGLVNEVLTGVAGEAVNELGDVAGTASTAVDGRFVPHAAIWKADGTRILATEYDSVVRYAAARDINNSGDVVIQMQRGPYNIYNSFVRLADGTMIPLPSLPGHTSVLVRGISERIGNTLYAGGTSDDRSSNYRPVRWTIDLSTFTVAATMSLSERGTGDAMTDDGTIAGEFISTSSSTGFVWTHSTTTKLSVPKGGGSSRVWSISNDGKYVGGDAKFGSYRKAVLWRAP